VEAISSKKPQTVPEIFIPSLTPNAGRFRLTRVKKVDKMTSVPLMHTPLGR